MERKNLFFITCITILAITLAGCTGPSPKTSRETILDKKVNIPKDLENKLLILHVPHLPPHCDKIPDNKKAFIPVKDGQLYYEEEGEGIPLVLINGGPGATHQAFHPYFSRAKEFARVIYYDQRGTGRSSKDETKRTYTINQAVEDLESLRKALHIDRWAVLGHSYGGFIAQLYALRYTRRCTKLILAGSGPVFPTTEANPRKIDPRISMFISKEEVGIINYFLNQSSNSEISPARRIYNNNLCGYWKLERYYRPTKQEFIRRAHYGWQPGDNFRETMLQNCYKINLKGQFKNFATPTLIIKGKWDFLWFNTTRESLRKDYPHAQIEVLEKAGHAVFADQPEKFFDLLESFLKKSERKR